MAKIQVTLDATKLTVGGRPLSELTPEEREAALVSEEAARMYAVDQAKRVAIIGVAVAGVGIFGVTGLLIYLKRRKKGK